MFEVKDFSKLLGLSDLNNELLNNHFKLYQGYVTNSNKVLDLLKKVEIGGYEYAELKRRFGWEFNGMRLHELFFGNLIKGGEKLDDNGKLAKKIINEFGSFESWKKDFSSIGMMRGIGWVVLCYDKLSGKLFNVWINEHDVGHLSGCIPLLVMDVFEHAFMIQFGLNRKDYVDAFFKNIDWNAVYKRLDE